MDNTEREAIISLSGTQQHEEEEYQAMPVSREASLEYEYRFQIGSESYALSDKGIQILD